MNDTGSLAPRVAVIGDYNEDNLTHRATTAELALAQANFEWIPTDSVGLAEETLRDFHGLWISPGSPYRNMDGALDAIRFARERGIPLVGT